MDVRSLRYFLHIAELGSFTRAAARLGVAQPALTRHLRRLEEELGTALLARQPRGVALTEAGAHLVAHGEGILRALEQARDEVRSLSQAPQGRVLLGVPPTLGPLLVPPLVGRARLDAPQVALKTVEGFSILLYDWLLGGTLDLAVMTSPPPSRALQIERLVTEELVLVQLPRARGTLREVTALQLAATPLVMSEGIRRVVEDGLSSEGVKLRVEAEIDAVEAIRTLVVQGQAATIMPVSTFWRELRAGTVMALRIGPKGVQRNLSLAWPAERRLTAAAEAMKRAVTAEIEALRGQGAFELPEGPPARASRAARGDRLPVAPRGADALDRLRPRGRA